VLVGVDNQGMANLWDAKNGESKGELDVLSDGMRQIVPSGSGSAIAFSADGKRMAVGGGSTYLNFGTPVYQIRVFEANPLLLIGADPLRLTWEHVGRGDRITSLAFSPNGKTLAQSGDRGTLRLWDVETGDLKHILRPDRAGASVVAFSSDGKLLAAGGGSILAVHADKRVTIWDAATGERLRTLEGPEDGIRALAFAPNSHEIACGGHGLDHGGSGGKATLWDADSGVLRWTWKGSDAGVQSLAFAPDGKTLAVCDGERVHLIDAASGEPKRRIAKSTRDRKSR
jgi:WD40 repeat protein